jgi:hypothetical protein
LTKEELVDLVNLIKQDFPKPEISEDLIICSNLPEISVIENSIEDFLGHEGLPKKLHRFSVDMMGRDEARHIVKKVSLIFYDNFIKLDVSGDSQGWVLGKYSQLINFLKNKKPFLWFLKTAPANAFLSILYVFISFGVPYQIVILLSKGSKSLNPILVHSISTSFILLFFIEKVKYTQITLEESKNFLERYNSAIVIISFIASIFGIIQFILGWVSK